MTRPWIKSYITVLLLALFSCCCLLLPSRVLAQAANAGAVSNQVVTPFGGPAANAKVYVCPSTATGVPCTPRASLFSDNNLTQPIPNPLTTDAVGNYKAYLAAGLYTIQVILPGQTAAQASIYYASPGSAAGGGGGGGGVVPATQLQIGRYCTGGATICGSQVTTDLATQSNLTVPGILTGGNVIVTTTTGQVYTLNPSTTPLQTIITSAGVGADIMLGCGTYATPSGVGFSLTNPNVHLHGPAFSTNCATVQSVGNPNAAISITGNYNEIDHISFTGGNTECIAGTGTTQSYIHHNNFTGCGAVPSLSAASGVFSMVNGVDDRIEYNVMTGNGVPQPGGAGGSCLNYQINNVNTPSWQGGTWGNVPCPGNAAYGMYLTNETRPHVKFNNMSHNNVLIMLAYFNDEDVDDGFNVVDQNDAYWNDTTPHAEEGQGYGVLCYDTSEDILTGTMARASNIVTWTGPNGTVIPYAVGDRIIVQFQFGTGGSDFNEGSPFIVTSVANSGGTSPTITWYQPGPNDSTTTNANIAHASSGHFVSDFITNTASSGFYSAGCSRAMLTTITVSHAGQMFPTSLLGVGGISINSADNGIVDSPNIDTVINTNQNPIAGQTYRPDGIVNSGSYNLQIINPQIKDVTAFGIHCTACSNMMVNGGNVDGFGHGSIGIGYGLNQNISGFKIKGTTVKGFTVADIDFPAAATGWGLNDYVEGAVLYGNTAAVPTADCAVFQTSSAVRMIDSTCDGAGLGQTGTMNFGIVNTAPNSIFTGNHLQNLTNAATYPFDDSSNGSIYYGNIELNNTNKALIVGTPGNLNSYAFVNAAQGAGAGAAGMLTPFILQGNCNGGLQQEIGLSGELYNTLGCIPSTGGAVLAFNAAQNTYLTNSWIATSATVPTDALVEDNTGLTFGMTAAHTCPTSGTNTFALCFGSTPLFKVAANGQVTYSGLISPPISGSVTANDFALFNGSNQLIDAGFNAGNLDRFCGQVSFATSTTSNTASCSWISTGSHCTFAATSSGPPSGLTNIYYTTTGTLGSATVQLTSSTSGTGTFAVMCSAN